MENSFYVDAQASKNEAENIVFFFGNFVWKTAFQRRSNQV